MKPIGLANYKALFTDYMFLDGLKNTTLYWVASLVLILPLALIIASLLNSVKKGRGLFKLLSFLPYITATVAVGLIFNIMFDYNSGFINQLIQAFGGKPVAWLTSTKLSKVPVIILNVWRITPWYTLILFSGLLTIPVELYEAATIDGANCLTKFFRITIPSLSNLLFFCFITIAVDSWKIFAEPYILTKGGPGTSSLSLFQYLYINGFTLFKLGYASAVGYILTLILLCVSVMQQKILKQQSGL
ncbi:carbohydrate ABC transporter permease [Sediminispirochaeta bajacaliforniensis]|uniref:carbohydrate ABC transporter permease n=1 Tax=Sediminispirochaeta bajacaliforniensis TaxID=148 RepID=UPI001FDF3C97|nr:sugar ABC transporter permease [Sediminispirochaeta bajacaliforniensis]